MSATGSGSAGRRLLAVVGAVVGVVAVLAALVVVPRSLPFGSGNRLVGGPGVAAPVPGGDSPQARLAAVQKVLAARGTAVRRDDAKAWARTQTAKAKAPVFSRLAVLPVVRWSYATSTPTTSTASLVVVPVKLSTRFAGETADATWLETVTLRRTGGRWLVVSEVSRGDRAALWELGTLRVVRGARSLVIGIDAPVSTLRQYAATADRVVPQVSAVWGKAWSRYAVVIVPRTVGQLARALGRTTKSLDGYAAVTTAEGGVVGGAHVAQRVWMNTPAMAGLSSLGRQVVLRHEMTHVATYAPEHPDAPLWIVEGVAEWMGYRGSGIPLAVATGDLLDDVRAGRAGTPFPDDATFSGAQVDVAYESSHLSCALVVEKYGARALVALYRKVAIEGQDVATAFESVTGDPLSSLTKDWRARARSLAS
ncbi:MAG: hypothetical protein U0R68_11855 [Candidatus Nanopelagicales bacterium]